MLVVIYEALCFDVAQGKMNGAPNKTRTHSCRCASLVLLTITPPEVPNISMLVDMSGEQHLDLRQNIQILHFDSKKDRRYKSK